MSKEKSIFEQIGGTYRQVGDYYIPDIVYHSGEQMKQIGKYGFLRESFLKENRKAKYQTLLLQDKIGEHLLEVDRAAKEREEVILRQLEERFKSNTDRSEIDGMEHTLLEKTLNPVK